VMPCFLFHPNARVHIAHSVSTTHDLSDCKLRLPLLVGHKPKGEVSNQQVLRRVPRLKVEAMRPGLM